MDPTKSLKIIKDHHKGSTVVSIGFCEFHKPPKAQSKANYFFGGSSSSSVIETALQTLE